MTYLGGLALAIVVGVVLGVVIGSSRLLLDASFVVLEFLRPIPGVALIPVAFLFFGIGAEMRRFIVAYAAVWPILVHTLYGVRGSDRMLHDVALDVRGQAPRAARSRHAARRAAEHRDRGQGERVDRVSSSR